MEGDIGWFRRNRLVPVPEVASLAELNTLIGTWDAEDRLARSAATAAASSSCTSPARSATEPALHCRGPRPLAYRLPGPPTLPTGGTSRRHSSATRIAEVLDEMELLRDDATAAIRAWIDDSTSAAAILAQIVSAPGGIPWHPPVPQR